MHHPLVYLLFLLSGAVGLVYELVWMRQLVFVFGGTTYAITTVLVAFMGGLGLGSYLAGRLAGRLERPARLYGVLEIVIGLYALLVPILLKVAEPAYRALYPHVTDAPGRLLLLRFALSVVVLVVPTVCMGATLPVLVRHVTQASGAVGRSVGALYGINTLGAVLGTLLAGFWLIPGLGLMRTNWLAAAANVLIGSAALVLLGRPRAAPVAPATAGGQPAAKSTRTRGTPAEALTPAARRVLLLGFAVSGFAAMVYQITWTRALIQSVGSSTYSFTCILAAFILGLAVGSLVITCWVDRWRHPLVAFGVLELMIGLIAMLIVPVHGQLPIKAQQLIGQYAENYSWLLAVQFALIIAVTFIPTFLMGAIFPLVARALAAGGREAGAATGQAYGVNTLGTIAGSFLAGFVLIRSDVLGVQNAILLASLLNGLVGLALLALGGGPAGIGLPQRTLVPAVMVAAIPLLAISGGRWDPRVLSAGAYLLRQRVDEFARTHEVDYYADGVDLSVSVYHHRDNPEMLTLSVNGKPDASVGPGDLTTQLLLGHLPSLLGPAPRSACVIGLGSGMTLNAAACHPGYQRLDCIEISAEVIDAVRYFAPYNRDILNSDPRVRLIRADGRNHLLLTDQMYDRIISEPSNPWIAGVANLFTREFFELCRARLNPDGLLAAWMHGYRMSLRDFQMVVRTLLEVFPHVSVWQLNESDYLLIAGRQKLRISMPDFQRRFDWPDVRSDLYRVTLSRPAQILGRYIVSDEPLRAWVAGAPIHTDDNALLEFSAPRNLYSGQVREIGLGLCDLQRPVLPDLLAADPGPPSPELAKRVAGVVQARDGRVRGDELLRDGQTVRGAQLMLESYHADPTNTGLLLALVDTASGIADNDPQLAKWKAEVNKLRAPPSAPRQTAPPTVLAAWFRQKAQTSGDRGDLDAAVKELTAAHELEPGDVPTMLALAAVLINAGRGTDAGAWLDRVPDQNHGLVHYLRGNLAVQAGDRDEALRQLEAALRSGAVTTQTLATDPVLAPLRTDPRFQALLAAPSGAPATRPAPATNAAAPGSAPATSPAPAPDN